MVKDRSTIRPAGRGWITRLAYGLFGGVTLRFKAFRELYDRSGIHMFYQAYTSLMFLSLLVSSISTFFGAFPIHHLILRLELAHALLSSALLSALAPCLVLVIFLFYPHYRRSQRGKKIDSNLVHTVSYIAVLSTAGLSIQRIFERVSEVEHHPLIRDLAKRVVRNTKVFGLDIVSSLTEVAQHSPSETLSKLMTGAINTVKTSGDLKELFMFEARRLLLVKRNELEKTLGTLMYLGEMYVAAMIVFPILIIIMLTILSLLGGTAFGLPPVVQINLVVFIGIPALAAVFLVIIDALLPGEG